MKNLRWCAGLLMMLFVPVLLSAKGITTRITLKGPGLTTPIEVKDPELLENFSVWAGPGVRG